MKGLSIESAEFQHNERRISMTTKLSSALPTIILKWVNREQQEGED